MSDIKKSQDFENNIIKLLTEKKGLNSSSITAYIRNLHKLNNDAPFSSFNFLKDTNKIIEKLKKYKENTKRNYLISIVSVLSLFKDNKTTEKLYNTYYDLMMAKSNEIKSQPQDELSKSQEDNWMSWDEVKKFYDKLHEDVKIFENYKALSEKQYNKLLFFTIMSLYILIEPRRNKDYQEMLIKDNEKDYNQDNKQFNYVDIKKKNLVYNNYKTSKTYGQKIIKIPTELFGIIENYLKHRKFNDGDYFLVNYKGNPLNKVNSITRVLNKTFDKNIGCSLLRHIFLTHKYKDILDEQQRIAGNMGHSIEEQKAYIKKPKTIIVTFD